MAMKKILDYTGPAFLRLWAGGILFIGSPDMTPDLPDGGLSDYVRIRIEWADAPEESVEPVDYFHG